MSTAASTVEVPDIGDFDDVPVIEILVAVGDSVAAEDPLVTLESDKATMDVPAPFAGVVSGIAVKIGDRVDQGSALMTIEGEGAPSPGQPAARDASRADAPPADAPPADAPPADAPPAPAEPTPARTSEASPNPAPPNGGAPIYASPSVRRLARERGIELGRISGSGRQGRITKDDVSHAGDAGPGLDLLPWPAVDFERLGPVERVPRTRIQRIAAPNLARNWVMIPHVTHNDEADVTELEAWRQQLNAPPADVKVTMVSFLVVACVAALREFPSFNASLDGDDLVLKRYYNIGFAADTPGGLVVPVIKDADRLGLRDVARQLTELSGRAREGKLGPGEMSGATFTISSLGGIGGTSFTPIINAPEVAILGVTRSAIKPVWIPETEAFVPRLMLPLSLSYDHRAIDGAAAARFTRFLVSVLSDLRRALL